MSLNVSLIPVITIDGPSGTGKGTLAALIAKKLGWHLLDSGALYRAVAWAILHSGITLGDALALQHLLASLTIEMRATNPTETPRIYCDSQDITALIRDEAVGMMASKSSALPMVRAAVLIPQRNFRKAPGLVADGRDMGTVVFPDATLKLYLDADPLERASRRFQQLQARGVAISFEEVKKDLYKRDQQDAGRDIAPLKPARDAQRIDTTGLSIEETFANAMAYVQQFVL
ncbi:MAG: cytidylate kinase [Coxiella sp. RIFCSPHIGHO2_12_FULL_42_15]|nr:MAG: cytidylate kinase [Coxiella sp. RIFCSPHIGHO2_12_FULL_42_15]